MTRKKIIWLYIVGVILIGFTCSLSGFYYKAVTVSVLLILMAGVAVYRIFNKRQEDDIR